MTFDPVLFENGLSLRTMTENDLGRVLGIERASFEHPWSKSNFLDEFKNPDIACPLVLANGEDIVAFSILWFIVDECHLANIAVAPDHRKKGLANLILNEVRRLSAKKGCTKILLEVRKSNENAIRIYEKFGFVRVGTRKGYYHDGFLNEEDAILMDYSIPKTGM